MTLLTEINHEKLGQIRGAAAACGFSRVAALPVTAVGADFTAFYEKYLADGLQADLRYLERKERFDLKSVFAGAQTILIFLHPYRFQSVEEKLRAAPYKIARYAWQKDYHGMLKHKLQTLLADFSLEGRAVTDSAPVLERYWARRAGLGRVGKNGMLIDKAAGSYFFIAAALVKNPVAHDAAIVTEAAGPETDFTALCKDCRLCIDACPTSALFGDGLMDTARCLSYQTIESKKSAEEFQPPRKKHKWIFGCDICQQVCPYNKQPQSYADDRFNDGHSTADRLAAGDSVLSVHELAGSVFSRSGIAKLAGNRARVDGL